MLPSYAKAMPLWWSRSLLKGRKWKKNFEIVWTMSMHYFINAWFEKGGVLSNYALWYGLEAYPRGVTVTNYF